jgi:hypothetical protein
MVEELLKQGHGFGELGRVNLFADVTERAPNIACKRRAQTNVELFAFKGDLFIVLWIIF